MLISNCGFIFEHFPATHSSSADFKWWVFIFGKTINRSPELLNLAAHSFQSGMQEQCESAKSLEADTNTKTYAVAMWKWPKIEKQIQIQKLMQLQCESGKSLEADTNTKMLLPTCHFRWNRFVCKVECSSNVKVAKSWVCLFLGMMPTHLAGIQFCRFFPIFLQHLASGAGARD